MKTDKLIEKVLSGHAVNELVKPLFEIERDKIIPVNDFDFSSLFSQLQSWFSSSSGGFDGDELRTVPLSFQTKKPAEVYGVSSFENPRSPAPDLGQFERTLNRALDQMHKPLGSELIGSSYAPAQAQEVEIYAEEVYEIIPEELVVEQGYIVFRILAEIGFSAR